jgi:two-component system chemotaxis response regulator CheV
MKEPRVSIHDAQTRGADNMAEVAEFLLGGQSFGINGSKIKQLVPYDGITVTKPPYNHPSITGVFVFRDQTVPLIDLSAYLSVTNSGQSERRVVVVTEFNEMTTAFVADLVNRIHRKAWDEFKPMDTYLSSKAPQILGSITIEGREILVLDFEQIVGEIFPETVSNYDESAFADTPKLESREEAVVFFAEDSYIIRTQLSKLLDSLGYAKLSAFENGKACFDAIRKLKSEAEAEGKSIVDQLQLVVTDIEMPQMDGMMLCRKIKSEIDPKMPVLMFSSLINEQVAKKCQEAGADAWVSKPQTDKLMALVDQLALGVEPEEAVAQ